MSGVLSFNNLLLFFTFKFWAFLVNHGGPEEKKRRDLIEELYKTEEAYVDNLKLVYEVFYQR